MFVNFAFQCTYLKKKVVTVLRNRKIKQSYNLAYITRMFSVVISCQVRCDVPTATVVKSLLFWVVMLCSPERGLNVWFI
jgi:hypothetical protein